MNQGVVLTVVGLIALSISLATGKMDALRDGGLIWMINWVGFWFGAILVGVGVARLFTIDKDK